MNPVSFLSDVKYELVWYDIAWSVAILRDVRRLRLRRRPHFRGPAAAPCHTPAGNHCVSAAKRCTGHLPQGSPPDRNRAAHFRCGPVHLVTTYSVARFVWLGCLEPIPDTCIIRLLTSSGTRTPHFTYSSVSNTPKPKLTGNGRNVAVLEEQPCISIPCLCRLIARACR